MHSLVIEHMDQGVLVADDKTRVIVWNRRACELLGVSADFLATRPTHVEVLGEMIRTGALVTAEINPVSTLIAAWLTLPESERRPLIYERNGPTGLRIEVRTSPLPEGGYVRTFTDITQRQAAEQALAEKTRLLDTTLETIAQGIILVDPSLRIVLCNRRYRELLDLPDYMLDPFPPRAPDIIAFQIGRGDFDSLPAAVTHRPFWDRIEGFVFAPGTTERPLRNGRTLGVETFALADGGWVRTFTDITEGKRAQDALLVSEKMASLGQLVAGIAHEINTPIGTGVTAASLLAEKTQSLTQAVEAGALRRSQLDGYLHIARESSRFILSNLTRAAELIQSFKQVAVDQATDESRLFTVRDYLEEILVSLQPRLKRTPHTMTLECPGDLTMYGPPGALFRVITNLVINSLMHGLEEGATALPGHMVLRVRHEKDTDCVVFHYHDTGRGIPEKNLKRVFDPFFTTRRGEGGTGLGLHIVYNLVTQTLGGTLAVHSPPGQGATFLIKVPRLPAGLPEE
nr:PAS-domain containing protein [Rhodospirillum rubrum]